MSLLFCRINSSIKHVTLNKSHFLSTKRGAQADLEALEMVHQTQVLEGRVSDMRHVVGNGKVNLTESTSLIIS